jgi:2-polyprenyl-3-methyl-5-hydroxy-6-metoxy-1,4-benzoquinol methylase
MGRPTRQRPASAVDAPLAAWNDRMYLQHPTPYENGIAGAIQRARVRTVLKLARVVTTDAVLEIGCEAGRLIASLPNVRRIVGVDISSAALDDAERRLETRLEPIELHYLDAQNPLPFKRGEFDVIICSEMLEHVRQPRAVLENIWAIADQNTRIVVTVPIEAPKVWSKRILHRLGLMNVLFRGIEAGRSEWHLQAFSQGMLRNLTADLFERIRLRNVWGAHWVALLKARPRPGASSLD